MRCTGHLLGTLCALLEGLTWTVPNSLSWIWIPTSNYLSQNLSQYKVWSVIKKSVEQFKQLLSICGDWWRFVQLFARAFALERIVNARTDAQALYLKYVWHERRIQINVSRCEFWLCVRKRADSIFHRPYIQLQWILPTPPRERAPGHTLEYRRYEIRFYEANWSKFGLWTLNYPKKFGNILTELLAQLIREKLQYSFS